MKPVLGVAEVGRIRVTDQRSRVSRRTRGEEALGPIESAYREQNGVPARSPDSLPVRCSPRLHFLSFFLSLSLSPPLSSLFFLFLLLLFSLAVFSSGLSATFLSSPFPLASLDAFLLLSFSPACIKGSSRRALKLFEFVAEYLSPRSRRFTPGVYKKSPYGCERFEIIKRAGRFR